jgi:hypothetical protein
MHVVKGLTLQWGRSRGRYPPIGMDFSTPVDNYVPTYPPFVDKEGGFESPVDKAVNSPGVRGLSTGLSTLLITYICVVRPVGRAGNPGISGSFGHQPTCFPHLWITCGNPGVVMWVTRKRGSSAHPPRLWGRAEGPDWKCRLRPTRQSQRLELSMKIRPLSTAQCTVGKTVPRATWWPAWPRCRGFWGQVCGCPQKLSPLVDNVTHFCGQEFRGRGVSTARAASA